MLKATFSTPSWPLTGLTALGRRYMRSYSELYSMCLHSVWTGMLGILATPRNCASRTQILEQALHYVMFPQPDIDSNNSSRNPTVLAQTLCFCWSMARFKGYRPRNRVVRCRRPSGGPPGRHAGRGLLAPCRYLGLRVHGTQIWSIYGFCIKNCTYCLGNTLHI